MCPIRYLFILILGPFLTLCSAKWMANFKPIETTIHMKTYQNINLDLNGLTPDDISNSKIILVSDNIHVADVEYELNNTEIIDGKWSGNFNVSGVFLGRTDIYCQLQKQNSVKENSDQKLSVTVIRAERVIDHVFTGSVALLVSVLYINFGAALDTTQLRSIIKKPIGPAIGFFGQFLIMPLLSYTLGLVLFPNSPELQLGLFFTGVSPAGGASNIWAIILNANMNLSITMTTISTFAAFAMMPLWIFTLGREIFARGKLGVPYARIAYFAVCLIIPLGIGLLIQKHLPRLSKLLVRILKPLSILLILFIVIFAIVTNLYLFELFSWQIIVAGLGLPWLGYTLGLILAKIFKQNNTDALAIAIETGIQNTGIAIFLLRFSLPQPAADLTTVLPVSVAIMTPFPLLLLLIGQKIRDRCGSSNKFDVLERQISNVESDINPPPTNTIN